MINAKTPRQLMEVYNQLPCACITVDDTGKIVNANNTFLSYTGFSRAEIINALSVEDFLPPENHTHINHLVNHKHDSDITYVSLITKDQNRISCSLSSMVLNTGDEIYHYYSFLDCDNHIIHEYQILDEKTQLQIAELRLVKLTLELHKVSHTITHEIQNPLQNILGLITLLKKNNIDSYTSSEVRFLDYITDCGKKLQIHFDELLDNSANQNYGQNIDECNPDKNSNNKYQS